MNGHNFFGVFPYINLQVFCLIIILYILIALIRRDKKKNVKTSEYLIALFVVCMLVTVADICWAFFENVTVDVEDWILYLIEEIYFSCCAFASYLWFVFQEKYSNSKLGNNNLLLVIIFIPCLVNIYFSVTASTNHFIYYISNDDYVRGEYHLYSALCNIAYLVAASVIAVYKAKLSHDPLDRYVYRSFIFYPLPMIIFGLLQTITGQSFNCIGLVVSFYILYVKIGTGYDRKELEAENNLIDDYDAVFIVNSEADTIRTLRMSDKYKQRNSHINKHENSYQARMKADIRKNIAENYRKQAEIEFDAKHVMERLRKQESYYYDYCIKTSSNLYEHYRAKFDRASNIGEGIFVLGIKNIEENYQAQLEIDRRKLEEERMLSIINNISNDVGYIEYIEVNDDKNEDEAIIYRHSEFMSTMVPGYEKETKVTKRYSILIDTLIKDEKQKEFLYKATRRENILKNLRHNPSYVVDFSYELNGKTHYYQLKFAAADRDEKGRVKSLVMGLKNIDAEVSLRDSLTALKKTSDEQETFIKMLIDSYSSAYYVDLSTDIYTIYKEDSEDKADTVENYEKAMSNYIDTCVLDKDRSMMHEMTSISYMNKALSNQERYYAIYTDTSKGNIFYKMIVIRASDGNHAALAFQDVNEEYIKEQQIQKELERQVRIRTKKITDMNNGVLELLGDVIERRSKESGEHVRRVRDFSEILALRVMKDYPEYGLDERKIEVIKLTSMLHDVGKISIPDAVLLKPGRLTKEEFEIMKTHCHAGYEVMKKLENCWEEDYLQCSYDICRYHHERWDGKGYPDGLVGNKIPISAQIVSLADCFDALTSKRVYKDAFDPETAFTMITTGQCGSFSEKMIATLFRCKKDLIKARDAYYKNE